MFISNLYRNDELQDTVEVLVLNNRDEHFFKSSGIQVDIIDKTYDIVLQARNAVGNIVEVSKGVSSMRDAYANLAARCRKSLVN